MNYILYGLILVPVNLIGFANETLPGDVVVNWSVNVDESTAVEGVEFDIAGSQSTSIAAGNSVGLSLVPLKGGPEGIRTPDQLQVPRLKLLYL